MGRMWSPQNAGSDPALRSHLHVYLECGIRPGSDPSPKEDLILITQAFTLALIALWSPLRDLILLAGSSVNTVNEHIHWWPSLQYLFETICKYIKSFIFMIHAYLFTLLIFTGQIHVKFSLPQICDLRYSFKVYVICPFYFTLYSIFLVCLFKH